MPGKHDDDGKFRLPWDESTPVPPRVPWDEGVDVPPRVPGGDSVPLPRIPFPKGMRGLPNRKR